MSNKIILNTLLLATLVLGGSSAIFSARENVLSDNAIELTSEVESVSKVSPKQAVVKEAEQVDPTVDNSVLLPRTRLNAFITSSTTTESSKAYDLTLSSTITCYTSTGRQVMTKIVSPEFNEFKEPASKPNPEDRPVFEGEVAFLTEIDPNLPIVIPSKMAKTSSYFIDVKTIGKGLGALDASGQPMGLIPDVADRSELKNIVIPATVETIDPNAFKQIPNQGEGVVFNVMAPAGTYAENVFPANATVNYNYVVVDDPATEDIDEEDYINDRLEVKVDSVAEYRPNEISFIAGYDAFAEDATDYPLTLGYYTTERDGSEKYNLLELDIELPSTSSVARFNIVGSNPIDIKINIPLEPGQVIDDERLQFFNIFQATQNKTTQEWSPIIGDSSESIPEASETGRFYVEGISSYDHPINMNQFLETKFDKVTTFGKYTSINVKVNAKEDAYKVLKSSVYRNNKRRLKEGTYSLRTRFMLLNSMTLRIYYEVNGELTYTDFHTSSKYDHYNLDSFENGNLNFLVVNSEVSKDFSPNAIRGVTLYNFNLSNDIYQNDRHQPLNNSKTQLRFASTDLLELQEAPVKVFNLSALIGIVYGSFVALFLIVTIVYFFVAKEKYKNDEFRRMKPKLFFKNAGIAFIALSVILCAALFIYSRWWPLNNSLVVYNPTDPLVIGFVVASLLAIGYYVKFFMNAYKAHKERVKIEKLKLQEDTADDGTK